MIDYTTQKLLNEKTGSATKLATQTSDDKIGTGLVPMNDKVREAQVKGAYSNTKNYSGISNNYSYRIQMQRQINKVKKH